MQTPHGVVYVPLIPHNSAPPVYPPSHHYMASTMYPYPGVPGTPHHQRSRRYSSLSPPPRHIRRPRDEYDDEGYSHHRMRRPNDFEHGSPSRPRARLDAGDSRDDRYRSTGPAASDTFQEPAVSDITYPSLTTWLQELSQDPRNRHQEDFTIWTEYFHIERFFDLSDLVNPAVTAEILHQSIQMPLGTASRLLRWAKDDISAIGRRSSTSHRY